MYYIQTIKINFLFSIQCQTVGVRVFFCNSIWHKWQTTLKLKPNGKMKACRKICSGLGALWLRCVWCWLPMRVMTCAGSNVLTIRHVDLTLLESKWRSTATRPQCRWEQPITDTSVPLQPTQNTNYTKICLTAVSPQYKHCVETWYQMIIPWYMYCMVLSECHIHSPQYLDCTQKISWY